MSKAEPAVQPHDFRHAEMLERGHHHAVTTVFENFAKQGAAALTAMLREQCTLALESMEQATWEDLAEQLGDGNHFLTFALPPLPGHAVLTVPANDALALVDLRLAGSGDDDYPDRGLTEIEQELFNPVVAGLLDELSKALSRLQVTVPELGVHESSAQFVSVASGTEMCLTARFAFTVGGRPACSILLCFPYLMVRHLVETMRRGPARPEGGSATVSSLTVRRRLQEVPVDLILQFPSFTTTPDSLMHLAVGDELHLGLPTDRPLELRAEGLLVALATIGRTGVRKACSITEEVLS